MEYTDDLTDDLKEECDARGAMVCDYATFRTIYRLSARSAVRGGIRSVIASITISTDYDSNKSDKIDFSNRIGTAIASVLRRDDVVTGFDTTRYLILLGNLTADNAERVIGRVTDRIAKDMGGSFSVKTDVRLLESAAQSEL
jgi:hypothetical protein